MSKLDRLKEEIAYQKQFLFIAIGIILGLSGWLGINVNTAEWYLVAGGTIVVLFSAIYAYSRHKRIYQLLQEIEDV